MSKEPGQDDFPEAEFREWSAGSTAFISANPDVMSLLYDINLLPEVVATFRDRDMLRKLVLVVEHFKTFKAAVRADAMEEAARIAEGLARQWVKTEATTAFGQAYQAACRNSAAAIRAGKEQPTPCHPSPPGENPSG